MHCLHIIIYVENGTMGADMDYDFTTGVDRIESIIGGIKKGDRMRGVYTGRLAPFKKNRMDP